MSAKVRLCAEISFDGRLLGTDGSPDRDPGPRWWTTLLVRGRSLPAEPGTVRGLLESGQVDELCLRVRPTVDGRRSQPTLSGTNGNSPFFARSMVWSLIRMATTADGGCLLHYRRVDGSNPLRQ